LRGSKLPPSATAREYARLLLLRRSRAGRRHKLLIGHPRDHDDKRADQSDQTELNMRLELRLTSRDWHAAFVLESNGANCGAFFDDGCLAPDTGECSAGATIPTECNDSEGSSATRSRPPSRQPVTSTAKVRLREDAAAASASERPVFAISNRLRALNLKVQCD
jgi:hypothetical protein